jgi:hypothetical protein
MINLFQFVEVLLIVSKLLAELRFLVLQALVFPKKNIQRSLETAQSAIAPPKETNPTTDGRREIFLARA